MFACCFKKMQELSVPLCSGNWGQRFEVAHSEVQLLREFCCAFGHGGKLIGNPLEGSLRASMGGIAPI